MCVYLMFTGQLSTRRERERERESVDEIKLRFEHRYIQILNEVGEIQSFNSFVFYL